MFALIGMTLLVTCGLATLALYAYKSRTLALLITTGVLSLASVMLSPVAHGIGLNVVQNGKVGGYHQFLNGSLVDAQFERFKCTQDGPCVHEDTSCDPYTVIETEYYTDANGKQQSRPKLVTHYHSCPHFTEEFTYYVTDNFGNRYDIASHIFAANPVRWRRDISVPGVDKIARGVPKRWQELKYNIDVGNADPVTVEAIYDNFVLGSERTILKESSDNIKKLRSHKPPLLPEHTVRLKDPIHSNFKADKFVFVGMEPPGNAGQWQDALMRFNAALGMGARGDMHVVAIKASALPDGVSPDDYGKALKAYSLTQLGKYAIAKNTIMVVLAVDDLGRTIQWAYAFTGMPVGNETMFQHLQGNLQGAAFDPDTVFGKTTARIVNKDDAKVPSYTLGSGIIPQTVMTGPDAFKRACMSCKDKEEAGQQGFVYLKTEIPLEGGALAWTIVLYLLAEFFVWCLVFWGYSSFMVERPFERPVSTTRFTRTTRSRTRTRADWPYPY